MDKLDEILSRGVANIIPETSQLRSLLSSGRKLNIYLGIDPTATRIHLGHAVPLRKLQSFVELGHHITLVIGDFTALIGDTSDKDTERPVLTTQQIQDNMATYATQAGKILDLNKVEIRNNSEWLKDLSFTQIVKLSQHFSAGDFFSRELIKKRLSDGKHVGLHELLYPVMQGYDSYFLDTDLQIGGTDQTFNMQAGRILQKDIRDKETFVLTLGFLEGTDGRKMSKSWGNAIWLDDTPEDIYGKIMSIKDDLIIQYFTLATNKPLSEVRMLAEQLSRSEINPMVAKKLLAFTVVEELHTKDLAQSAQQHFEAVIQGRGTPEDISTVSALSGTKLSEVLSKHHLVNSNSEFRRLILEKGIKINGEVLTDPLYVLKSSDNNTVVKIGKLRYLKITIA